MSAIPRVIDWHWEVTRRCNLLCPHCAVADLPLTEPKWPTAIQAIKRMAQLGGKRLYLTGGEPLVRRDLPCIIRHARDAGMRISLITNGVLASKAFLQETGPLLDQLAVSIDGDETTNDLVRGNGSYEKAIAVVINALRAGIPLSVYVTLTSANVRVIGKLTAELHAMGVDNFHFKEVQRAGRAQRNQHLLLPARSLRAKAGDIFRQLRKHTKLTSRSCRLDTACALSPNTLFVSAESDVYACSELALHDQMPISNLFDPDIRAKITDFFARVPPPKRCCYAVYRQRSFVLCLNRSVPCPLLETR